MANYPAPPNRKLQIFSLDPAADIEMDTAMISRATVLVPWENLEEGPIGEYIEVIDFDPSVNCFYDPIDLSETLTSDGLAPSTGNPQFHQQMVYAVASMTIANFERILGRKVLWAQRVKDQEDNYWKDTYDRRRFVRRLRIYPHAIRDQNAYYSPGKKALLFGYFNTPSIDVTDGLPGGIVFTCLSHDIIAHETTHAILDGIHPRLLKPSNPDMLALHEGFSDIIAIFQHFSLPNLLNDQIQRTRGELLHDNLLSKLAIQFARSTGKGNALRNALGLVDETGKRSPPDPRLIDRTTKPHDRGAILVAAVYAAFFRIYESRVVDLRRIATNGTGVLPEGDIHPDLAKRFATEAANAANRVLTVCIRAIDYIPAVDCDFGDYLRALVTADADLVPDDPMRFRLAFIEAFKEHGIYPRDVRTLAEDSLRWDRIDAVGDKRLLAELLPPPRILRTMASAYGNNDFVVDDIIDEKFRGRGLLNVDQKEFETIAENFLRKFWVKGPLGNSSDSINGGGAGQTVDRFDIHRFSLLFAQFLHVWIKLKARRGFRRLDQIQKLLGIDLSVDEDGELVHNFEVHAVRPTVKSIPGGRSKSQLLIILTQKVTLDLKGDSNSRSTFTDVNGRELSYKFRGGCTLIIDPEMGEVEYAITKRINSRNRRVRQNKFILGVYEKQGEASKALMGIRAKSLDSDEVESQNLDDARFPGEIFASIHADYSGLGEY